MGSVVIKTGSRVYLDANVFIYAFETPGVFPAVPSMLRRVARGELSAVTSALTLAEVLVIPLRRGDAVLEAGYQTQITPGPTLAVVDVSRDVLIRAASIRASTPPVKLPDAIHAATALLAGCDVLLTNDARLAIVTGLTIVRVSDLA